MHLLVRSSSLLIAALGLSACGGGADQAAKQAASAASAAELIAAQRTRGAIPAGYAADLLDELRSELGKSGDQLASGGSDGARAKDKADQLGRVLGEMSKDVRAGDGAALGRASARAGALGRALTAASARMQAREGGGG